LPLAVPIATIAHVELCGRRGEWRLLRRPLFSVLTLEQSLPRGRGPSVSDDGVGGFGGVGASWRRHFALDNLSGRMANISERGTRFPSCQRALRVRPVVGSNFLMVLMFVPRNSRAHSVN